MEVKHGSYKKKHKYKQKFSAFWLNNPRLASWIEKPTREDQTAYCKYCQIHLTGSISIMYRHGRSKRHIYKVEVAKRKEMETGMTLKHDIKKRKGIKMNPKKLLTVESVRQAEMRLCAYVAEQNLPLSIMDTLPGLLKALDPESEVLQHIQCSHTKTAYIMKNALASHTINLLAKKLQSNLFSLIVDDSQKFLILIARYYDDELKDVEDSFLNILDIESSWNSLELFQVIMSFLGSIDVPVSNLLAITEYSSSTTTPPTESSKRIEELSQYVYIPGYVGHRFHLCTAEACKELPTTTEDFCNDILKFIHKKKLKCSSGLKQNQRILESKFRNITTVNRILIYNVVDKIIESWDTLLSYFTLAVLDEREEKAETILKSLRDPIFKAYFIFLNSFLPKVEHLNEPQNMSNCLPALLACIGDQVKIILKHYMNPQHVDDTLLASLNPEDNRHFLHLDNMYFGFDVAALKLELDPMFYNEIHDLQIRCLNFYVAFCKQLLNQADFSDPILNNLMMLSPHRCKSDCFPSIIPLAKHFPNLADENMYEQLDREWRLVKASANLRSNMNFMEFWNHVYEHKYELSTAIPRYPHLTRFVKSMLSLPHTSEATEKIFEKVSVHNMKSKSKTKRETPMINSLLLTKEKLKRSSAKDFEITDDLLVLGKCANGVSKKSF